jgi:hypothetical protein
VKGAIVCFLERRLLQHKEDKTADPGIALLDYLRNMGLELDDSFLQEALQ